MAVEINNPETKEAVLTQLTAFWKNNDGHGLNEQEEVEFERIYGLLKELGASRHEVLRAEFLAEPDPNRQGWLNSEVRSFHARGVSLEDTIEYVTALRQIRDEFNLVDPYKQI